MSDLRRTWQHGVLTAALVVAGTLVLPSLALAGSALSVSGVSPRDVAQGATRTVTVSGSGFASGAVVTVSGAGLSIADTQVLSPRTLTIAVTASAAAPLGARTLTVSEVVDRTSSLAGALRVTSPPTLTGTSPDHLVRSGRDATLHLTGTGFERGLHVRVEGGHVHQTTVASSTTAAVVASLSRSAPIGTATVTVVNPDGGTATLPVPVDATPQVASISSPHVSKDETVTETLVGTGFEPGARLDVGPGIRVRVTSVTPTSLVATLRTDVRTQVGPRTLTLTNPDGGDVVVTRALHVGYQPIFAKWAVGDGAIDWTTTLKRPTFAELPSLSFSGTGVTVATETERANGTVVVGFTIARGAATTWRTMTMRDGTATWVVPRALKVRVAPRITRFPSLPQGTLYLTVKVRGENFEVCSMKDPVLSVSGTGVTINKASPALGDLMYVNVTVAATAATGARNVTMTNCDSGGRSTAVGVFTVTAS